MYCCSGGWLDVVLMLCFRVLLSKLNSISCVETAR